MANLFNVNKEKEKRREKKERNWEDKSKPRGLFERLGKFVSRSSSPVPVVSPKDPVIATGVTPRTAVSLVTATLGTAATSTDTAIHCSALPGTHQIIAFGSDVFLPPHHAPASPSTLLISVPAHSDSGTVPVNVSSPSAGDDPPDVRESTAGQKVRKTIWSSCKTALHLIMISADVFPPAKSAVCGLLAVIDLFEVFESLTVWSVLLGTHDLPESSNKQGRGYAAHLPD